MLRDKVFVKGILWLFPVAFFKGLKAGAEAFAAPEFWRIYTQTVSASEGTQIKQLFYQTDARTRRGEKIAIGHVP